MKRKSKPNQPLFLISILLIGSMSALAQTAAILFWMAALLP
jgi:hypothetical protein